MKIHEKGFIDATEAGLDEAGAKALAMKTGRIVVVKNPSKPKKA